MNFRRFAILPLLATAILAISCTAAAQSIVVRNNYEMPYSGPITFHTNLPNGIYAGKGAQGCITDGTAYITAALAAQSRVELKPRTAIQPQSGPLFVAPEGNEIKLSWNSSEIGRIGLALAVIPGRTAKIDNGVSPSQALDITFTKGSDGTLKGNAATGGYDLRITFKPYAGGWMDVSAEVTNISAGKNSAYVGLIRKITTTQINDPHMRWNGQFIAGTSEPTRFVGSSGIDHCIDWCSWKSGSLSFTVANGFTPGITIEREPGRWVDANHFYVWEHLRADKNSLFFISEIAGPDPGQKEGYTGIKAYTQPLRGEPVKLHWRLAIKPSPEPTWEESQFLTSAGYRRVTSGANTATVDLGVPYVEFGTSYFPYSTMCENFDYYRTPRIDREGWWPFSPKMWENWRAFAPQMRTDLRIIKSMGFEWVRMHHLELLAGMDRKNALAFIDFYMNECRKLGLKVLIDTAGSPQWFSYLAGRYKDVAKRIEIENEILIPGIKPGDPERWTACYRAAKEAAPTTDIFLTGCENMGMFDRLTRLGVPYDRLGYHTYRHGIGGEETLNSAAVAAAGCAADRDAAPVLSEFNWKMLTRLSPEARTKEWALIFGNLLKPRATPELLQFQWQETMSVNPRTSRQGVRHYETIYLDRRPKPEAFELMKLIRRYSRTDAPIRELPITIKETIFASGKARAAFTVKNMTSKPVTVKLGAECFADAVCKVIPPGIRSIKPGASASGAVEITLKPGAMPGVYHFFIKAEHSGKASYGWGYASNIADPRFDPNPVISDLVEYPQGIWLDNALDWSRPTCVAFGPDAPIVEMEMAYIVFNTLQSATGRTLRLCSTADIPANMLQTGNLILIGTPKSNPLIAQESPKLNPGKGTIISSANRLLLTGDSSQPVEAASIDFVLRYWKNAKDSALRVTDMEKGAALGNKITPAKVNPL